MVYLLRDAVRSAKWSTFSSRAAGITLNWIMICLCETFPGVNIDEVNMKEVYPEYLYETLNILFTCEIWRHERNI